MIPEKMNPAAFGDAGGAPGPICWPLIDPENSPQTVKFQGVRTSAFGEVRR
jgi:hypothetical protein